MLVTFILCAAVLIATVWKREVGLAVSIQAYLIKCSLNPPDYSYGPKAPIETNDLLSILIPIIVFGVILLKTVKKDDKFFLRPLDVLFVTLGGVLLGGSMYSPLQNNGLFITFKYFALGISFYFVTRLFFSKTSHFQTALKNMMNTTWLLALFLGLFAFIRSWGMSYNRLTLGSAHPIPFSLLLAIGIVINYGWLLRNGVPLWKKSLQAVSFIILLYIFIDSNTRGTIISAFVAILFITAVFVIRYKAFTRLLLYVPLILVGIGAVNWINPNLVNRVSDNLSLITSEEHGQSINGRQTAYMDAWEMFNNSPFFGVGTGAFQQHSLLSYPHNTFLELLSENGIIGFLVLLAVYMLTIYYIINICRKGGVDSFILASVVLLNLIETQFSFTLWMHKSFYLYCGVLVAHYYKDKMKSNTAVHNQEMKENNRRVVFKIDYSWR
jgi:O-antigen ligase